MYNQDYDLYAPQIGVLYGIIEPIGVHIYIIQKYPKVAFVITFGVNGAK